MVAERYAKLQPAFETLPIGDRIIRAKALLRGKHAPESFSAAAFSITRIEDWLEFEKPKCDRASIRALRRELEARAK